MVLIGLLLWSFVQGTAIADNAIGLIPIAVVAALYTWARRTSSATVQQGEAKTPAER